MHRFGIDKHEIEQAIADRSLPKSDLAMDAGPNILMVPQAVATGAPANIPSDLAFTTTPPDLSASSNVRKPPDDYRVIDLHGKSRNPKLFAIRFFICDSPDFDLRYFRNDLPLHSDFAAGTGRTMHISTYLFLTTILVALLLLPVGLALAVVGIGAGTAIFTMFGAMALCFFVFCVAFIRERSEVEQAWRRYATAVYEKAEKKPVVLGKLDYSGDRMTISFNYPNGYLEVVGIKSSIDKNTWQKLAGSEVSMSRDRSGLASVVILEKNGHRLWCTSRGAYLPKQEPF